MIFTFNKSINECSLKFAMADGAWEISNALKEVYGDQTKCLMYWSHMNKCLSPKLSGGGECKKSCGVIQFYFMM